MIVENSPSEPLITILLATYNGGRYLEEQLESIAQQSHKNWCIVASDDGSSDVTVDILKRYQHRWGEVRLAIRMGPQSGYAKNFLSLAGDPKIKGDYFAFCDQDDVWLPEKLRIGLLRLEHLDPSYPSLYGSRTIYTDERLRPYAQSPLFIFPPSFRNSLVQSICGGNTMIFNRKTKLLIERSLPLEIVSHDWLLYQLVSGSGGKVIYDPDPHILYRQHNSSVIGENQSLLSRIKRAVKLLGGDFKLWSDRNIAALNQCKGFLTDESKMTLEIFERLRQASLKDRIRLLGIAGLYRQTWRGTISMHVAAILNKL